MPPKRDAEKPAPLHGHKTSASCLLPRLRLFLDLICLSYTVLRMYIFGLASEHARVALVDNKASVLLEGFISIFLRRGTVEN